MVQKGPQWTKKYKYKQVYWHVYFLKSFESFRCPTQDLGDTCHHDKRHLDKCNFFIFQIPSYRKSYKNLCLILTYPKRVCISVHLVFCSAWTLVEIRFNTTNQNHPPQQLWHFTIQSLFQVENLRPKYCCVCFFWFHLLKITIDYYRPKILLSLSLSLSL